LNAAHLAILSSTRTTTRLRPSCRALWGSSFSDGTTQTVRDPPWKGGRFAPINCRALSDFTRLKSRRSLATAGRVQSRLRMQMWQCGDKRMAWETSLSGSSGIHAGRERRSLGPGAESTADVAALATRCGSDWLQRAHSPDVAPPCQRFARPRCSPVPHREGGRGASVQVWQGRALMAPMLESEGPGRARCAAIAAELLISLSHICALRRSHRRKGAQMQSLSQVQSHTKSHKQASAQAHTHKHTRTLTRTHTQCNTCTQMHTRSITHTQCNTDAQRNETCIRPSAQRSRHAIPAVCHAHDFEGSDRCATFIDRNIGKTRASPVGPVQDAQARGSKQSHDPSRQRRVTNGTHVLRYQATLSAVSVV
jgi:hypothetical protein